MISPYTERIEISEVLLSRMPQAIYIHFPGATWVIHEELGEGVYPLTPVSRTWIVNKRTKVKARRTGYFLVPDFASTAHMIQKQSLEAAFVDVVNRSFWETITTELQIAGYVMLSRAKFMHKVWIMQAFCQCQEIAAQCRAQRGITHDAASPSPAVVGEGCGLLHSTCNEKRPLDCRAVCSCT